MSKFIIIWWCRNIIFITLVWHITW
jgi:hypothetical protein